MAVGFDTVESLNSLWAIHRRGELTSLIHDVLITSDVLKAASITAITIETKLWDDEYDVCKHDISTRFPEVLDIQYRRIYIFLSIYSFASKKNRSHIHNLGRFSHTNFYEALNHSIIVF
jgi:hypothetical protein